MIRLFSARAEQSRAFVTKRKKYCTVEHRQFSIISMLTNIISTIKILVFLPFHRRIHGRIVPSASVNLYEIRLDSRILASQFGHYIGLAH